MILYCDSSALVKLYVSESGSDMLKAAVERAAAVATCRISWAEVQSALARRARERPADAAPIRQAREALAADWPAWLLLEVNQALVERAGDYADTFALRAYDAVQLAAARTLAEAVAEPVEFACFDERLNKAAKVLGMVVSDW